MVPTSKVCFVYNSLQLWSRSWAPRKRRMRCWESWTLRTSAISVSEPADCGDFPISQGLAAFGFLRLRVMVDAFDLEVDALTGSSPGGELWWSPQSLNSKRGRIFGGLAKPQASWYLFFKNKALRAHSFRPFLSPLRCATYINMWIMKWHMAKCIVYNRVQQHIFVK